LEELSAVGARVSFCIWHDTNVIRPTLQSRLAVSNLANLKCMPSRAKKNMSVEIPKELYNDLLSKPLCKFKKTVLNVSYW
jgi:hypothetical protein